MGKKNQSSNSNVGSYYCLDTPLWVYKVLIQYYTRILKSSFGSTTPENHMKALKDFPKKFTYPY